MINSHNPVNIFFSSFVYLPRKFYIDQALKDINGCGMQRRLIKQGESTLTLSLPAEWTKRFNLKQGDPVEIEDREGSLTITAQKSLEPQSCRINIEGVCERITYRTINAAYIKGMDEIEVIFDNPKQIDCIQRISDSLMGFTIIKQGKNSCVIKDISGVKQDEFDNILRRAFLIVMNVSEDIHEGLQKKDRKLFEALPSRDWSVNKLCYACLRILNKHGYAKQHNTTAMYNLVWALEALGDEYMIFAQSVASSGSIVVSQKILKQYQELNKVVRKVYELLYTYKKADLAEIYRVKDQFRDAVMKITPANPNEVRIITCFERIFEIASDMIQQIISIHI